VFQTLTLCKQVNYAVLPESLSYDISATKIAGAVRGEFYSKHF